MKTHSRTLNWVFGLAAATVVASVSSGCSSMMKGGTKGEELSSTGPTVVDVQTNPSTIELNQSLAPTSSAEVLADVKDFTSRITEVPLRFLRVPLEVPMEHVGGTTWRARLSPEQLKTLAVSGKTMRYEANVIARNEDGQIAVSKQPVDVAVRAPDLNQRSG